MSEKEIREYEECVLEELVFHYKMQPHIAKKAYRKSSIYKCIRIYPTVAMNSIETSAAAVVEEWQEYLKDRLDKIYRRKDHG